MTFEKQYDPERVVELCRAHDGLTTMELAEHMDVASSTMWDRCQTLADEGRIEGMRFGRERSQRWIWFPAE